MEIEEEGTKKKMDALKVFSASIKYLRDHMVSSCKSKFPEIEEEDILWILTVPAIWTDAAKQFMRMAAEQAGISSERLKIALEPEAASIYCKYLPMGNRGNTFEPGSKYMVIDAGGGTIDITVHEVQTNNSLKELYSANGGPWGGTNVDDALQSLLTDIFGKDVMQEFSKSQKMDQLDLFRDFEIKKKTVKPEFKKDEFITLRVPHSLSSLYSVLKGRDISSSVQSNDKYKAKLKWFGEKLRMEPGITKALFDKSCNQIVKHVQSILCENAMRDVGTILLVGWYAESLMLQKAIETNFNQLKVIPTPEAGLSVLKGSVIFGHEPDAISSRVSTYTYGIRTNVNFNPSEHPEKKKTLVNGIEKCKDIFNIHVRVGETMHVGEPTTSQTYVPQNPDQKTIGFTIFTSPCKNPKFTTDQGCRCVGYLRLYMPETSKDTEKEVDVQMTFSGTEIEVSAIDKITKKAVKTSVDFLH
ncbi:heat shock 70 kDa protein 12A-like [Saccostrea cucullata]|uniref:heat shock 70 kDa protein 12A-like n=1 Tax=Saccostrea cuccullata TaxID=36930 RepID=UPI002ED21240